jgi:hypothetical protein
MDGEVVRRSCREDDEHGPLPAVILLLAGHGGYDPWKRWCPSSAFLVPWTGFMEKDSET